MVADVTGKFDRIGHATRAKTWIGIGWPDASLLLFVIPPEVKVRCAHKDGGDSIDQGDGLAMDTEEWGYQHNGFNAISILGHPSSGDGAAREAHERDAIPEPGCDVEPDGCLVE
jgi:hypothetical protein